MMTTKPDVFRSRKRQALLFLAVMQATFTVSVVIRAQIPPVELFLFDMIPLSVRATMWVVLAIVAASVAFTDLHSVGWVLLMAMPIIRVAGYSWSAVMMAVPGAPPGLLVSIPLTFFWLGWVGLVWVLAGWPDLASQTYLGDRKGRAATGAEEEGATGDEG